MQRNIKQLYAIKKEHEKRLLKLNPKLDHGSGIYFFIRKSEQNENEIYVGQSVDILRRCVEHMMGFQYIDLSVKAHKLYSEDNPHGYKIEFIHFRKEELDEKEQYYIKLYGDNGWILKNKTSGSQGVGKEKIADYRPAKGYRDGIKQGKINLARQLSDIISKHLVVTLRPDKANNKVSIKQYEKFKELIDEETYKDGENE